jgi:ribosomal protein S12 methylthiotransferase
MKVGFISLGCPKNLVDSEVMLGFTEQAGHEIVSDPAAAEVLVVNTCGFIESAKQESIDAILELAEHRRSGACRRLVVTGCLAQRYGDELREQVPEIDAMVGTGQLPQIVKAIGGMEAAPGNGAGSQPTYLYDAETPRRLATPGHYAYVKIAEGCDYACSFCIIPQLRGRYRSREAGSIVAEARSLAAKGVRELILVSQDTSFFGFDRGEKSALATLVRELNEVDGLAWIRLLYLHPATIRDELLAAIAECEKVCSYVDLPLQHGSDEVLRRMRRPGTRSSYERLISRIRDTIHGVTLRTTFIVGYPGETEKEFDELCRFARDMAFDHAGVFAYSHEEGTPAFALEDDVPRAVKQRRLRSLMSMQKGLVAERQRRLIGRRMSVMVDGSSPEHPLVLLGRLEGQAPEIDPVVYLTDCDPTEYRRGTVVAADVVAARGYDLVARPVADDACIVIN